MALLREFKKRIYSHPVSIGLQRDLNDEFQAPPAKINIEIRPLRKDDVAELLEPTTDPSVNSRTITFHPISDSINEIFYEVTDSNKYKTSNKHLIPMSNHTPKVDSYN